MNKEIISTDIEVWFVSKTDGVNAAVKFGEYLNAMYQGIDITFYMYHEGFEILITNWQKPEKDFIELMSWHCTSELPPSGLANPELN